MGSVGYPRKSATNTILATAVTLFFPLGHTERPSAFDYGSKMSYLNVGAWAERRRLTSGEFSYVELLGREAMA